MIFYKMKNRLMKGDFSFCSPGRALIGTDKATVLTSYLPGELFFKGSEFLQKGVAAMNARQKRFCDEYLIDCNAKQAAIRAGYSPKTAYSIGNENLNKPELKAYIEEQLEKIHNEKTADAQEVLEYLTAVMRGQHTEQVLKLVGEGVQTITDIDVAAKERIKAAELIGKRYGLFKDNLDVGGAIPVVISGGDLLED